MNEYNPRPSPDAAISRTVSRVVPEPTALKALAHPVRLRMLGMLRIDGPATATQLAARLGLNSGATSYHLRQLAQYGFIEEAPHGSRRDRWWRARHELTSVPASETQGEALDLDVAFNQAALSLQVGQMQQALEEYAELPAKWRKATAADDIIIPMTAEKAEALTKRLSDIILEAMREAPPLGEAASRNPDIVPFYVMLHAFPYPGRVPHRERDNEP
ncbi:MULTISPECIES: helix-turn-helix domain-containing protein [Rhizobium]|uniref:ArsR/SmtB family transcription factor n=1 Tax=Rhizobium TaxID=379 RepID=UPI001B344ACA|nr:MULTISPECIES: helix-turn-helix domain-containing protein [Rhizobium]MBX4906055.1 helix-turn-helix transcriptional regulator [Rhizobium bangladeshense]MBX5212911.1 helix-turn-helix transcriptional regulator [Rhizobium sp. NLR9a]MBX5239225.1 helix-turn-helix transcriptional regulator [Rhizobium sp. NLR22b]MBX5243180.1 helix-turn-helix transcriptional regulator [Rhizobium sp. NLR3b]MBX5249018.1 helix-turn-helix transcriptional regulator [Rhizobium sp. NLR4b]